MVTLDDQLAALATMSSAQLKEEWHRLSSSPVPRISPKMMRLALAWELQARAYGGLSRDTTRRLDQFAAAKTKTSPMQPSMRLVREWNGKAHVVMIGEDKVIRWNDREWRSLSQVAKAITGTHWSGPAFFGLKRKVAA
jgi:predicted component of type VI protein secretion system